MNIQRTGHGNDEFIPEGLYLHAMAVTECLRAVQANARLHCCCDRWTVFSREVQPEEAAQIMSYSIMASITEHWTVLDSGDPVVSDRHPNSKRKPHRTNSGVTLARLLHTPSADQNHGTSGVNDRPQLCFLLCFFFFLAQACSRWLPTMVCCTGGMAVKLSVAM